MRQPHLKIRQRFVGYRRVVKGHRKPRAGSRFPCVSRLRTVRGPLSRRPAPLPPARPPALPPPSAPRPFFGHFVFARDPTAASSYCGKFPTSIQVERTGKRSPVHPPPPSGSHSHQLAASLASSEPSPTALPLCVIFRKTQGTLGTFPRVVENFLSVKLHIFVFYFLT